MPHTHYGPVMGVALNTRSKKRVKHGESDASAGPQAFLIYRDWMSVGGPLQMPSWRPPEISTDSMLVEGRGAAPSIPSLPNWEGQQLGLHQEYPFGDSLLHRHSWNPTFSESDIQIYRDTVEQTNYYNDFIDYYIDRFTHWRSR